MTPSRLPVAALVVIAMGIGMVLFVDDEHLAAVEEHLAAAGEDAIRIGRTEAAAGEKGVVRWA